MNFCIQLFFQHLVSIASLEKKQVMPVYITSEVHKLLTQQLSLKYIKTVNAHHNTS